MPADLPALMPLYDAARGFMRRCGNRAQWINGYPSVEVLARDIERGNLYVALRRDEIVGAFAFIIGEEPTYAVIERGQWPDNRPYGTIHRLVSSGAVRGLADICFSFCRARIGNLRVDTHCRNLAMRRAIRRNGFSYCGIIHVADGSPRLAFQLTAE